MPAGSWRHGRDAVVRAYWARQFAAGRPLVRLEGLGWDGLAGAVVVTVRLASGEGWAGETVDHVCRFGVDGLVVRMGL